ISCYIKSKFVYQSVGVNRNVGTFVCGSVTDGHFKLEVRIADFKNTLKCEKGSAINIIGRIQTQGPRIYLQVDSEMNIQLEERDPLPIRDVLLGFRELKRVNEGQIGREDVE
ncbi:uncharacterized protein LOC127281489, partial [Leptopilina boulardi]|uniref:uncharacterized protein LOC127281489 n=1 Tax=Leptopilina boulardi TaxID=63433 RepID=UPI0021F69520